MAISMYGNRGRNSGPNTNQTSIGGVSAVNPNAQGNFNQYIDAAYGGLKSRLDPAFEQNRNSFDQKMQNMGIPIGGEAYNKAWRQMGQNENDALTNAGMQAMQFGLGAQAQDFGQDATRSQLANALLQSKWNTDLSSWGMNMDDSYRYAALGEGARQFDDSLLQRGYEFDTSLGEGARQFDAGQDFNYWDRGNAWDLAWDRAGQDDMRWLTDFDRSIWNDQMQADRWTDQLGMHLTQPFNPTLPNVGSSFVGAQNANLDLYGRRRDANTNWWQGIGEGLGDVPWGEIFERYGWGGG